MTPPIADRAVGTAHHELGRLLDMGQAPSIALRLRTEFIRLALLGTDNGWLAYGAPEALELASPSTIDAAACLGPDERHHLTETLQAARDRKVLGTWTALDAYSTRIEAALAQIAQWSELPRTESESGDPASGNGVTPPTSSTVAVPTVIGLVGKTSHPIYRGLTTSVVVRFQVEVLAHRPDRGGPDLAVEGVTGNGTREAFLHALEHLDRFGPPRAPDPAHCVCRLSWNQGGMITGQSATAGFLLAAVTARSLHAPGLLEWSIQPGLAISADLEGTRLVAVEPTSIPQKVQACLTAGIVTLAVARGQVQDFLAQVRLLQNDHPDWQMRVEGVDDLADLLRIPYAVASTRRPARTTVASWVSWAARSTTLLLVLAMILVSGLGLWGRDAVRGRNEPVSLEIDEHGLFLVNKYGRTCGRIDMDGVAPVAGMKLHVARSADVRDLDADGHGDVLIMVKNPQGETRELLALDRHGQTMWRLLADSTGTVTPEIEAGVGWRGFHIFGREDGRAAVLTFRRSRMGSFTAVEVIDGPTGRVLGQVTNWGHLEALNIVDLERDGVNEFIIGGTQNAGDRCLVAVLDPEKLVARGIEPGSSTPPSLIDPSELGGAIPLCLRLPGDSFVKDRRPSLMEAKEEGRHTTFVVSPDLVGYDLVYRFIFPPTGPPRLDSLDYTNKAVAMQNGFTPPVTPEQRRAELTRLASAVEILTPSGFERLAP